MVWISIISFYLLEHFLFASSLPMRNLYHSPQKSRFRKWYNPYALTQEMGAERDYLRQEREWFSWLSRFQIQSASQAFNTLLMNCALFSFLFASVHIHRATSILQDHCPSYKAFSMASTRHSSDFKYQEATGNSCFWIRHKSTQCSNIARGGKRPCLIK